MSDWIVEGLDPGSSPAGRDAPYRASGGGQTSRFPRHGADALRVGLAAAIVVVAAWLAHLGTPTVVEVNAFRLVNQLPGSFAAPLLGIMQLGALAAVPFLAAVALLRHQRRLARFLVVGGVAAWGVAKALQFLVDEESPEIVLRSVVLHGSVTPGLAFPATHVAVAAALATVAGPYLSRANRRLAWWVVAVIGIARIYVGAHFPVDVVGGAAVGWGVGSLLHVVLGVPRGLPGAAAVRHAVATLGMAVDDVLPLPSAHGDPKSAGPKSAGPKSAGPKSAGVAAFRVVLCNGSAVFAKVVGRDQPETDWLYRAWRVLAFRELEDRSAPASPVQRVEHQAYMLLSAERAGIRAPGVITTRSLDGGEGVLVRRWVEGTSLAEVLDRGIDDRLLDQLWEQLSRLHRSEIALGSPVLEDVVVDVEGKLWFLDLSSARMGAGDDDCRRDVAELCVLLSARVAPTRVARTVAARYPKEDLTRLLDHLQPLELSPPIRQLARERGHLGALRAGLAAEAGVAVAPMQLPVRVAARNLLPLLVALVVVNVLLPQVGQASATVDALHHARWPWLVGVALISVGTYLCAAVALMGASGRRLALGRTWAVQVAAAFTNRLLPAGLGGMGTNVRYLEASGALRPAAVAAVALSSVAGFVVHLVGVLMIVPLLGSAHARLRLSGPELPDYWPVLVGVVGALSLAGAIRWGALLSRHVAPSLRSTWRALAGVARRPIAVLALFAGSAGVTAGYALAMVASARAFGIGLPVAVVVAVYLGASAVSSLSPTPGGLGALEAALVAGMTAAGAATGPAVATVLVYRLVTYWLPVLPGVVAFRSLRRAGIL